MRTYHITEAARLAGVHPATVARLVQRGVLTKPERCCVAAPNQAALKATIVGAVPKHGWTCRRRSAGLQGADAGLRGLLQWAALPAKRRATLLQIAERFGEEELELLTQL